VEQGGVGDKLVEHRAEVCRWQIHGRAPVDTRAKCARTLGVA
jgi:hypothetical protein